MFQCYCVCRGVPVEVVAELCLVALHVVPPVADEQLLVEQCAVGAQEGSHEPGVEAYVEHLALGLCVGEVSAVPLIQALK